MLKLMCAVISAIVLATIVLSTGVCTMHSHHVYLLADGGQPPPGPLPICWPWDYPCTPPPPQVPQTGSSQLLPGYSSVRSAAPADRPRNFIFRAA